MQVVEYDLRLRTSLAEHRAGPQIPGGGAVEGVGFGFGLALLSDEHHRHPGDGQQRRFLVGRRLLDVLLC